MFASVVVSLVFVSGLKNDVAELVQNDEPLLRPLRFPCKPECTEYNRAPACVVYSVESAHDL